MRIPTNLVHICTFTYFSEGDSQCITWSLQRRWGSGHLKHMALMYSGVVSLHPFKMSNVVWCLFGCMYAHVHANCLTTSEANIVQLASLTQPTTSWCYTPTPMRTTWVPSSSYWTVPYNTRYGQTMYHYCCNSARTCMHIHICKHVYIYINVGSFGWPLPSFLCLGGLYSAWPHPVWHSCQKELCRIEGVQLATDKDNLTRWLICVGVGVNSHKPWFIKCLWLSLGLVFRFSILLIRSTYIHVWHLTQEPKESLHGAKHHMNTVERGLIAHRQVPLMTLAIFMTNRSCPGAASYICGAGQRLYIGNIVQESLGQYRNVLLKLNSYM